MIYSLIKCVLEDDFKHNCSENVVIFVENYPRQSLLLGKLKCVE